MGVGECPTHRRQRRGVLLTDRQQQVFLAAVEQGYYETPRRATLTDVAESMEISKATASNILHRAEGRIVDWFVATAVQ
ncbi:helix-turn-helix domain-containing protein [Halogranum amylolyticum]|uniref:helix-turn-helix domain-containing protein n=1 Tax=Halogranum amylolyticum TaxID=660520 RepID=UPI001B8B1F7D|nr:helix-turn-helix domain-containing protein [Halogranum amylolyticum]